MKKLELPKELNNIKKNNIDNSKKINIYLKLFNQNISNNKYDNTFIIYLLIILFIYILIRC